MKSCIICDEVYALEEGINVLGKYICQNCESKIVKTSVQDGDYLELKDKLKKLWVID